MADPIEVTTNPPAAIIVGPWTPPPGPDPDLPAALLAHLLDPTPHDGYVVDALNGVTGIWKGTAAQYAAIGSPVATVIYFVTA